MENGEKTLPKNVFGPPTYDTFPPPFFGDSLSFPLKERGTDQTNPDSEASKSGFGEHTLQYVSPPPKFTRYVLPPPSAAAQPLRCPKCRCDRYSIAIPYSAIGRGRNVGPLSLFRANIRGLQGGGVKNRNKGGCKRLFAFVHVCSRLLAFACVFASAFACVCLRLSAFVCVCSHLLTPPLPLLRPPLRDTANKVALRLGSSPPSSQMSLQPGQGLWPLESRRAAAPAIRQLLLRRLRDKEEVQVLVAGMSHPWTNAPRTLPY